MKDRVLTAAALGAIAVVAGSGVTVASARVAASSAPQPIHSVAFDKLGASVSCGSFDCVLGVAILSTFKVPAGSGRYAGVVTLSFQYRTSSRTPAGLGMSVSATAGPHRAATVRPTAIKLASSPHPTTTSVSFRVTGLRPGRTYEVQVGPKLLGSAKRDRLVEVQRIVTTVQAWPTG